MHSAWTKQDTQSVKDTVIAVLRKRFGNHPDFEDFLQESMMHVYANRNKIPTGHTRRAYIGKMVIHRVYDFAIRHNKQSLDALELVQFDKYDQEIDLRICEELTVYQPEMSDPAVAKLVSESVQNLSFNHRQVLLLKAQDLNYKTIAAILNISVGTVRSRLHHAKRICASQLAPHFT